MNRAYIEGRLLNIMTLTDDCIVKMFFALSRKNVIIIMYYDK